MPKKYGWEGASQAWFGGEGSVGKLNRKDVLGTSIGGYGSRFSQLFDQHGGNSSDAQIRTTQAVSDGYIDANRKLASGAVQVLVGMSVRYLSKSARCSSRSIWP